MMLSAARLRELLNYNPETGVFTHRIGRKGRGTGAGMLAGSIKNSHGRHTVGVDGKNYLSYRLAWFYVNGEWPSGHIDHINGDMTDNRFANLRLATYSENGANARKPSHNTSGFKGVSWNKNAKKWRAVIKKDRKPIHIGYFDTAAEAHAAYIAKAAELFGEFARAA